jgi:hypothetical protein
MRPTFEDASGVWMERGARIRFGDVGVYTNGGFLVVHRVVGVRSGPRYRTKGDGLPHLDVGFVPAANVLGRVVAVERGGRRLRADGAGARLYGLLVALLSGLEGFLYRAAWRLDRILAGVTGRTRPRAGYAGGVSILRRSVRAAGRVAIGLADRFFFRLLHRPAALPGR